MRQSAPVFRTLGPSILIDTSAWASLGKGSVPPPRRTEIEKLIVEGRVAVCLPFLLEAGYVVRNGREHRLLLERLLAMPRVWVTPEVEELALSAQAELALASQHRLPPTDVLLAALAHCHSLGVLHYDAHFDHISKHSTLSFESVWLAQAGSL